MSGKYKAVGWNRQKRLYDGVMALLILGGLLAFAVVTFTVNPNMTPETVILRFTAGAALLLLHVILCIGPLARMNPKFHLLLYNRRHLGVTMFLLALIHSVFATLNFHSLGGVNPLVSIFTAYQVDYAIPGEGARFANFPFEPFGLFAFLILFLMAATSHDFWLNILGASVWKTLHVLVYVAYGLILIHVALGALQFERHLAYPVVLGIGFVVVVGLHLLAQRREAGIDKYVSPPGEDGFIEACPVSELQDGHGKSVRIGEDRLAVFRDGDRIYALSNVCRHQGGPIGEGRILDGCITCPWHGWQYRPDTGTSPPPFHEVIATYPVRVVDGRIYVKPEANPLESTAEGALFTEVASS